MLDEQSFSVESFSTESWYFSLGKYLAVLYDSFINKVITLKSSIW